MDAILWIQNETPKEQNTYIIDGVISTYNATKDQEDAMDILVRAHEWDQMYKNIIKELIKRHKVCSAFVWYQSKEGIMIKSCHQERDEANRLMPFMFYTNSVDIDEAIPKLKDYSEKAGRTCFEGDMAVGGIIKKKGKLGIIGLLSLIALLILWILWMI